jgi:hypothetical protein
MMGRSSMMYSSLDVSILIVIAFVFGILAAGGIYVIITTPLRQSRERKAYLQGYMDGIRERGNNAN